jgi:hypothetical protein
LLRTRGNVFVASGLKTFLISGAVKRARPNGVALVIALMTALKKNLFFAFAAFCFAAFAGFASFASAALPIENCADVLIVSFNQQAVFSANDFNPGSPSTVKIAGKPGYYFWFEDGKNGSSQFDVVVSEERGFMHAGDVVFKQYGENTWFSKDDDNVVQYDCALNGGGKTDEFRFAVGANRSFELTNGKTFVADYVRVKAKRSNAFRLRDDFLSDEFDVLTTRVYESSLDYWPGTIVYASPSEAGKFELYYAFARDKQYARIPYVSCCAGPLATAAPSAAPSTAAASAEPTIALTTLAPTAVASVAPSRAPTLALTATPAPSALAGRGGLSFSGAGATLAFIVVFVVFVAVVFLLVKGKPPFGSGGGIEDDKVLKIKGAEKRGRSGFSGGGAGGWGGAGFKQRKPSW